MLATPYYMAPELLADEQECDTSADVWSFGICCLEMANGVNLYEDMGRAESE